MKKYNHVFTLISPPQCDKSFVMSTPLNSLPQSHQRSIGVCSLSARKTKIKWPLENIAYNWQVKLCAAENAVGWNMNLSSSNLSRTSLPWWLFTLMHCWHTNTFYGPCYGLVPLCDRVMCRWLRRWSTVCFFLRRYDGKFLINLLSELRCYEEKKRKTISWVCVLLCI